MKLMPFLPYSNQYLVSRRAYDLFCKIDKLDLRETSGRWKPNAFNLVAEMKSSVPLTMTFRVHRNLYRSSGTNRLLPVHIAAMFHEDGAFTTIEIKIKCSIVYCIGAAILAITFAAELLRGKFLWPLLVGAVMMALLDYLEKYNLLKKFESLLENIAINK